MYGNLGNEIEGRLSEMRLSGVLKNELVMTSLQSSHVDLSDVGDVLNLCANNYLGLAGHPEILRAAHEALDRWGYGMASVRFICGTQAVHLDLEQRLSEFLGTESTILFGSCFDANGGLFEALLDEKDAIVSDELNHASIIDGIRLCKARRLRFRNSDMDDLAAKLDEARDARYRLIATDGVFSMDGYVAKLDEICDLADRHEALVMVDDSHAVGVIGASGRGTPELHDVADRVDIITGTLGKAMGGASGGYVSGRSEIIELLRQRSRPYLFSNSVPPPVVAGSLRALELIEEQPELRTQLTSNAMAFREGMLEAGFNLLEGDHPIIPVMIGDEGEAARLAAALVDHSIYAVSFSFPVVPVGTARIRTQMSAAHDAADIRRAIDGFRAARSAAGLA